MERPTYDEKITRQNDIYAMDVIERFRSKPKNAESLMRAITEAFILGAGGYDGSFDAAMALEYGGMEVLLSSLGLEDIDKNLNTPVDSETFEQNVRASVDFGVVWDELEEEIPPDALSDTQITGDLPFLGPLTRKFVTPLDDSENSNWRED